MSNSTGLSPCEAAYRRLYTGAVKQESKDEKRGYTELCYAAEQIHEAFESGFDAALATVTAERDEAVRLLHLLDRQEARHPDVATFLDGLAARGQKP